MIACSDVLALEIHPAAMAYYFHFYVFVYCMCFPNLNLLWRLGCNLHEQRSAPPSHPSSKSPLLPVRFSLGLVRLHELHVVHANHEDRDCSLGCQVPPWVQKH